jgi:electron transport complex protein RnfB
MMQSTQKNNSLIDQIEVLLPQTQCRKCGFSGCHPYAEAIATGKAEINQCPPGGQQGITALARLLGIDAMPLNEAFGKEQQKRRAVIVEEDCIGCTKCLPPCPVDAILGAAKYMHTVIVAECTGCELCVEPCPVDCIIMQPFEAVDEDSPGEQEQVLRAKWKQRHQAKIQRHEREQAEKAERTRKRKVALAKIKAAKTVKG